MDIVVTFARQMGAAKPGTRRADENGKNAAGNANVRMDQCRGALTKI